VRLVPVLLAVAVAATTLCSCAGPKAASTGTGTSVPFRRVVTGFDAKGRSTVTWDGRVPEGPARDVPATPEQAAAVPEMARDTGDTLWVMPSVPVDLAEVRDPAAKELALYGRSGAQPPRGGVAVESVRYDPGGGFPMHATATLDVIVVTSGAMELVLDTGSTIVRAGDVVIQRGTPHAWRTVGDEPCAFVSIMADATGSPVRKDLLLDKQPIPPRWP
jgi:quercetin dioxygenase-like cupin family protein